MRQGVNPQKNKSTLEVLHTHQLVIPVYIPNHEGFFKDAFRIFKLSLESALKTIHPKTYISIVNNGCCEAVVDYLQALYKDAVIHEVIHTSNIGKINAILKGVNGHDFPLVTIADADVLFLTGWQNETVKVFNAFPKAGVVGIVPQFKMFTNLSHNILFDKFWSKDLQFSAVKNPEALKLFYKSIAWDDNYNKDYLQTHLSITSKHDVVAVVGSGHFVATYKKEALVEMPQEPSTVKLGNSLQKYLDEPVLKAGGWRLTTQNNYAYHMGNTQEAWMDQCVATLERTVETAYEPAPLSSSRLSYLVKNHLFRKLLSNKLLFRRFLKYKGLEKHMVNTY